MPQFPRSFLSSCSDTSSFSPGSVRGLERFAPVAVLFKSCLQLGSITTPVASTRAPGRESAVGGGERSASNLQWRGVGRTLFLVRLVAGDRAVKAYGSIVVVMVVVVVPSPSHSRRLWHSGRRTEPRTARRSRRHQTPGCLSHPPHPYQRARNLLALETRRQEGRATSESPTDRTQIFRTAGDRHQPLATAFSNATTRVLCVCAGVSVAAKQEQKKTECALCGTRGVGENDGHCKHNLQEILNAPFVFRKVSTTRKQGTSSWSTYFSEYPTRYVLNS